MAIITVGMTSPADIRIMRRAFIISRSRVRWLRQVSDGGTGRAHFRSVCCTWRQEHTDRMFHAGEGLIVCNEIHPARAKILSENIERMGVCNALVTNETPQKLSDNFREYFDRILVDAPCSGEECSARTRMPVMSGVRKM